MFEKIFIKTFIIINKILKKYLKIIIKNHWFIFIDREKKKWVKEKVIIMTEK
jgi:hypothetical protein